MGIFLLLPCKLLVSNSRKYNESGIHNKLTLSPDQYDWNLGGIPVVGHFVEVIGHCIIAGFVLKTENKYNRIHPSRKLEQNKTKLLSLVLFISEMSTYSK